MISYGIYELKKKWKSKEDQIVKKELSPKHY